MDVGGLGQRRQAQRVGVRAGVQQPFEQLVGGNRRKPQFPARERRPPIAAGDGAVGQIAVELGIQEVAHLPMLPARGDV